MASNEGAYTVLYKYTSGKGIELGNRHTGFNGHVIKG